MYSLVVHRVSIQIIVGVQRWRKRNFVPDNTYFLKEWSAFASSIVQVTVGGDAKVWGIDDTTGAVRVQVITCYV